MTRSMVRVSLGHSITGCLETTSMPGVKILGSRMSPSRVQVLALPLMTLEKSLCFTVLGGGGGKRRML